MSHSLFDGCVVACVCVCVCVCVCIVNSCWVQSAAKGTHRSSIAIRLGPSGTQTAESAAVSADFSTIQALRADRVIGVRFVASS